MYVCTSDVLKNKIKETFEEKQTFDMINLKFHTQIHTNCEISLAVKYH